MASDQATSSHGDLRRLRVGIAIKSKLWRTKVEQAIKGQVESYQCFALEHLADQVREFEPQILILDTFCMTERSDLFESVLNIPILDRPRIMVAGNQNELDQEIEARGVDSLLCFPFIPEMMLLKLRSMMQPAKDFEMEQLDVLRKMRKYQRIEVQNMQMLLYKPFRMRAKVLDVSYQGLKAETSEVDPCMAGTDVQLQLVHGGANLNLAAQLVWVRDGQVGVMFKNPRPAAFDELIEKLYIKAFEEQR